MATKKTGTKVSRKVPVIKPKKPVLVTISADLQKLYPWFREGAEAVIGQATLKLQKKHRQGMPLLSSTRARRVAAAHELIQRRLNLLSVEQERYTLRLKAYWGQTGIPNIDSRLGETLVNTSLSLAVDPDDFIRRIGTDRFMTLVASVLDPFLLLKAAQNDEVLRLAIQGATRVAKSSVAVTAPSSRRAKSGKPIPADDE